MSKDEVADEPAESTSTEDTEDTDVAIEDVEVSEEEMDDPEDEEETSADEETEEEGDSEEETEEESEDEDGESEEESKDEPKEEPKEEVEDTATKKSAEEAYRRREAERNQKKSESQQEYLDDADDDKDLALRQLQVDAYNSKIERNVTRLATGIQRAAVDNPILAEGTPEQKAELSRRLDDFERMYVTKDANGDPIEVKADVHQYMNQEAQAILKLAGVGARQQKRSKADTKSRTLNPPGRKPKAKKVDEDLQDFDDEIGRAG